MHYFAILGPVGIPELIMIVIMVILLFGAILLPKMSRADKSRIPQRVTVDSNRTDSQSPD
jgi:hypothetical protein